jgi:hypothetical protein
MTSAEINLDDPQTREYVAEFLDARRDGVLGSDWTAAEYVARRQRDEERKQLGALCAGADDDFEKEL